MVRSRIRRSRTAAVLAIGAPMALVLGTAAVPSTASAAADPPKVPVFVDGQAQPVFTDQSTWVHEEVWVETSFDSDFDGKPDRVHADVSRPGETETQGLKVPVVYETSPYYAGTVPLNFWEVDLELGEQPSPRGPQGQFTRRSTSPTISRSHESTWIPRGFAVVHSESPGSGLSQGCATVGGDNESLAPKAVVDWLNGRAKAYTSVDGTEQVDAQWSTGKVGMTGTSYNGTLPLAAATTGVEGLEAIIPDAPNTSYYEYYRSNGLVRAPGGYQGEDVDVLYDFIDTRDGGDSCNAVREEMMASIDRVSGDFNDFWAQRDYLLDIDGVRAATLLSHGLSDWNVMPDHSVRIYEALRERGVESQLYLHQGGHGGPPPLPMMNRWFSRYLYGIDNGVEQDPRANIVREGADRTKPTAYADYPNPSSTDVEFALQPGGHGAGALLARTQGSSGTDRAGAQVETLTDDATQSATQLAGAASSPNRLVYSTPKLTKPLHVSGAPAVTLRVASSTAAANLSVMLYTRDAAGTFRLVTRGWADPQNHDDAYGQGEALRPGKPVDVTFEMEPDDQIIPAGQQLHLMVFSSDKDHTLRPRPGTQLSVHLKQSRLHLPVVGGVGAL
jgi:X-Pro dipeptidyl-peptidase